MSSRNQRGFTLVELLVVIAIIATMVALLLPAVQAVRESARKSQCSTNMRQVAMATIAVENAKGHFPGFRELIGNKVASWVVPILPGIEQQQLYDQWKNMGVPMGPNLVLQLPILICPSRAGARDIPDINTTVANAGFWMRPGDPAPMDDISNPAKYAATQIAANGIFLDRMLSPKPKVSASDIRDGASNTILFSESFLASNWANVTPGNELHNIMVWLYCNESGAQVDPHITTNTVLPPQSIPPSALINGKPFTTPVSTPDLARPSSYHTGGVNCVFADGRTTFVSQRISYHVYQNACTPNAAKSFMPWRTHVLSPGELE